MKTMKTMKTIKTIKEIRRMIKDALVKADRYKLLKAREIMNEAEEACLELQLPESDKNVQRIFEKIAAGQEYIDAVFATLRDCCLLPRDIGCDDSYGKLQDFQNLVAQRLKMIDTTKNSIAAYDLSDAAIKSYRAVGVTAQLNALLPRFHFEVDENDMILCPDLDLMDTTEDSKMFKIDLVGNEDHSSLIYLSKNLQLIELKFKHTSILSFTDNMLARLISGLIIHKQNFCLFQNVDATVAEIDFEAACCFIHKQQIEHAALHGAMLSLLIAASPEYDFDRKSINVNADFFGAEFTQANVSAELWFHFLPNNQCRLNISFTDLNSLAAMEHRSLYKVDTSIIDIDARTQEIVLYKDIAFRDELKKRVSDALSHFTMIP